MDSEIIAIQKQIEDLKVKLSEARRRRPVEPIQNYRLIGSDGNEVALSALFGDKRDLIAVHNMGTECVYCTMWADGFVSLLPHLESRAAIVIVSPDSPEVQKAFADGRNWPFRMISSIGSSFSADLGYADPAGKWVMPGFSAFHLNDDGTIVRTGHDRFGPGDDYSAPWRLFDSLLGGVGDWEPQYTY